MSALIYGFACLSVAVFLSWAIYVNIRDSKAARRMGADYQALFERIKQEHSKEIEQVKSSAVNDYLREIKRSKLITSPSENIEYQKVRADFYALTWSQKIAIKYLIANPGISEMDLLTHLQDMGFSKAHPVMDIINPLLSSPLIDYTSMVGPHGDVDVSKIEVKFGKAKIIADLLLEDPLC